MNWLAHVLLAESDPEIRLGNLLGDLIKGKERETLNANLRRGLKCHQAIDIFTDRHPIVRRSKQRLNGEYRRFAGILIDVFYDHILAKNWHNYSSLSLAEFTSTVYKSWDDYLIDLPIYPQQVILRMMTEDWLSSYIHLQGVEQTLKRISWKLNRRSKRQFDLTPAIALLQDNYFELQQDFQLFFPQLQSHVDCWCLDQSL